MSYDLTDTVNRRIQKLYQWRDRYSKDEYPYKVVVNLFYELYTIHFMWDEISSIFSKGFFARPKRYDNYNDYKSQISPRIAFRTKILEGVFLKSSIGKGFKAPDFRQLYFNFSNSTVGYSVIGFNVVDEVISELYRDNQIVNLVVPMSEFDDKLNPESSVSFNLGINYIQSDKLKLGINLFRNDINDLIDF